MSKLTDQGHWDFAGEQAHKGTRTTSMMMGRGPQRCCCCSPLLRARWQQGHGSALLARALRPWDLLMSDICVALSLGF